MLKPAKGPINLLYITQIPSLENLHTGCQKKFHWISSFLKNDKPLISGNLPNIPKQTDFGIISQVSIYTTSASIFIQEPIEILCSW